MSQEISLDFNLHPAQMQVFSCPSRFIVMVAGRRMGKSHLALARAVCSAMDERNVKKLPVWIVAPVQPQAKAIYWNPLLRLTESIRVHTHINDGLIELINGVQISIKGADRPDTLRGIGLWDLILDEFATMKPVTWDEILRPALSDVKGRTLFIGTPSGRNHFYKLAMEAKALQNDEWAYFHFTTYDNPYLPAGEIEAAKRTLSSAAFRQEYLASFETGGSDVFQRDWIKYSEDEPKKGDWYVAADLAGFTDAAAVGHSKVKHLDMTAIPVVKVSPSGDWWVKSVQMGRWGVEETARRIVDAVDDVKALRVGIERGTLFNAVTPHLMSVAARRRVPISLQALSHGNQDKQDRIVWALQGKFEHGRITLNPGDWNEELVDQLVNFPSKMVKDDGPDALAMIDQMVGNAMADFGHDVSVPYWKPIDAAVGF